MKSERNYGIDCLKILAAFLVLILHLFTYGEYAKAEALSAQFFCNTFFRGISIIAVNLFALASGYCSCNKKMKLLSLFRLLSVVWFYSVSIKLLFCILNHSWSIVDIVKACFPVSTNAYWYITSYVLLFFAIPILNSAIDNINMYESRFIILSGALLFGFQAFITHHKYDIYHVNCGLSAMWLMYMYFIGAYVKKHTQGKHKKCALILYLASTLLMFVCGAINSILFFDGKDEMIITSYNFIFNLISSVSLFYVFVHLELSKIKESPKIMKIIECVSKHSLAIYVLNCTKDLFNFEMKGTVLFAGMPAIMISFGIIIYAAVFFGLSVLVDVVREKFFQKMKINDIIKLLAQKIEVLVGIYL